MNATDHPIIFFDGFCNLCSRLVQLIVRLDKNKKFRLASLQSSVAGQLLNKQQPSLINPDTIVYFEDGNLYYKSDAVLKISRELGGLMLVFQAGYLLPGSWRDGLYDLIARNRYRWFGRRQECMVPKNDLLDRFLD